MYQYAYFCGQISNLNAKIAEDQEEMEASDHAQAQLRDSCQKQVPVQPKFLPFFPHRRYKDVHFLPPWAICPKGYYCYFCACLLTLWMQVLVNKLNVYAGFFKLNVIPSMLLLLLLTLYLYLNITCMYITNTSTSNQKQGNTSPYVFSTIRLMFVCFFKLWIVFIICLIYGT